MNTWIQYGRGKVIKRYVRNRVTIKMISALTGWYSNALHDVVVGIATPDDGEDTLWDPALLL